MHHTAWTKHSSLPSDRIPPSSPKPPKRTSQPSANKKAREPEIPKSSDVRALETIRDALSDASGRERDPKGGCFCQARTHPLSPYTPLCQNCGLILCTLQRPHYACPHCATPLLTPAARTALLATLDERIADTLAKEAAQRARAAEQARTAAGAFPVLSASASATSLSDTLSAHPANQAHKVLSLNSKTKKLTVKSYARTPPAVVLEMKAKTEGDAQMEARVPRPPPDVVCSPRAPDAKRPWANLRGFAVQYVPPPNAQAGSTARRGKGRSGGEGGT